MKLFKAFGRFGQIDSGMLNANMANLEQTVLTMQAELDALRTDLTSNATADVAGPSSAVDSRLASFDGITGKLLKDAGKLISDFAPTGFGLGGVCQNISSGNLNDERQTGFYMGESMTNAPDAYWYYVINLRHNSDWCTQVLLPLSASGQYVRYRMQRSSTWQAWANISATSV